MEINRKQGEFLKQIIQYWESEKLISSDVADNLKNNISVRPFDWGKLAKYSFWIAIFCGIIAVGAVLADEILIELITMFFTSSDTGLAVFFALLASYVYYLGIKKRKKTPEKILSNESIIFGGVLFTAVSIGYLGQALDTGSGHFSLLFLLSTIIYASLAYWFPSRLVWIFSILSLGSWFGTETGYVSGWGAYFLGMNYPLRFVLFGSVLLTASIFMRRNDKLLQFAKPTYVLGMLYLFISLWILSIFGNYGDMDSWSDVKQYELFYWSLLFGAAALTLIYFGIKFDDGIARNYGITFLFINLYTRYFEYFWNSTHKAIFFTILAVSFWFVGYKAEKIRSLEFLKRKEGKTDTDLNQTE